MAKIGLPKGSGKRLKVREKSVKSQGILKWILSGNPASSSGKSSNISVHAVHVFGCCLLQYFLGCSVVDSSYVFIYLSL